MPKSNKSKKVKNVVNGRVYITATFNNTLVTITDNAGNTLCFGSAGTAGFKGTRKSTPFAATSAVDQVAKKAINMGLKSVEIYIKGPGPGRDSAIRALKSAGLEITMIADVTPIPHNGVRPKKQRRV
ncbi:MAG TPA: 30S ribosomal protein S11 [Patescibacteria group bacterium]